jgi:hypothetical protein
MTNREAYHIAARIDGATILLREQLNREAALPTVRWEYAPASTAPPIPVIVYWKSPAPADDQIEPVRRAVFAYCAQLHGEQDYEGPVNCCL